ncbi:MAG: hypothetical protein NVS3B21_21570 [Acidimicrobiales bacterium]
MAGVQRGWADRVAFYEGQEWFAYRPNEVIVAGGPSRDVVSRSYPSLFNEPEPLFTDEVESGPEFFVLRGREPNSVDVIDVVEDLRSRGIVAQPNHVLFAHGACCCGPHPSTPCSGVTGSPLYASPLYASPVYASPVYASPLYASPVYASPVYASGLRANGQHKSSARPAPTPTRPHPSYGTVTTPRVAVLDTGFAGGNLTPALLSSVRVQTSSDWEGPDDDGDGYLDPAAGHGTFIAGLVEQFAPGCNLTVEKVLSTFGDGDEAAIAARIDALDPGLDLLNLSFGGYAMEQMHVLAAAVRKIRRRGTVVVASAGNDATCRPTFPAALTGVIGVGALGPNGAAPFTNYGPWVRACAPGVDLVSSFFKVFDGSEEGMPGEPDPDKFDSWARWSGTSFAAPMVVAALAREMQATGKSAQEAAATLIDSPWLARVPGLGTVVNLA